MNKMKKYLFVVLITLFTLPVCAQKGKLIKAGADAASHGLAQQVGRQMTEQSLKASLPPGMLLARIANLSGEPLVQVEVSSMFTSSADNTQVLPARILTGEEFRQRVFPEYKFRHLPLSLGNGGRALYRGLALEEVDDVTNILINGVQLEKSSFSRLYFSADVVMAISFANEERALPVVVKVEVNSDLEDRLPFSHYEDDTYTFLRDVPARFVTKVLTYLEIDGKSDWYEAVLLDGKLTFKPEFTQDYTKEDLTTPKFYSPSSSPDIEGFFSGDWW